MEIANPTLPTTCIASIFLQTDGVLQQKSKFVKRIDFLMGLSPQQQLQKTVYVGVETFQVAGRTPGRHSSKRKNRSKKFCIDGTNMFQRISTMLALQIAPYRLQCKRQLLNPTLHLGPAMDEKNSGFGSNLAIAWMEHP